MPKLWCSPLIGWKLYFHGTFCLEDWIKPQIVPLLPGCQTTCPHAVLKPVCLSWATEKHDATIVWHWEDDLCDRCECECECACICGWVIAGNMCISSQCSRSPYSSLLGLKYIHGKWLLFSLNKATINIKTWTNFHFCVVKYHILLQAPLSVQRQWSYWSVRKTLSAAGASKPSQSRPTLSSITPYHDQPGRLRVKLVWCVQL